MRNTIDGNERELLQVLAALNASAEASSGDDDDGGGDHHDDSPARKRLRRPIASTASAAASPPPSRPDPATYRAALACFSRIVRVLVTDSEEQLQQQQQEHHALRLTVLAHLPHIVSALHTRLLNDNDDDEENSRSSDDATAVLRRACLATLLHVLYLVFSAVLPRTAASASAATADDDELSADALHASSTLDLLACLAHHRASLFSVDEDGLATHEHGHEDANAHAHVMLVFDRSPATAAQDSSPAVPARTCSLRVRPHAVARDQRERIACMATCAAFAALCWLVNVAHTLPAAAALAQTRGLLETAQVFPAVVGVVTPERLLRLVRNNDDFVVSVLDLSLRASELLPAAATAVAAAATTNAHVASWLSHACRTFAVECSPMRMFVAFVSSVSYDSSVLLDLLLHASSDSSTFVEYVQRLSEHVVRGDKHDDDVDIDGGDDWLDRVESTAYCLDQLQRSLRRLAARALLPAHLMLPRAQQQPTPTHVHALDSALDVLLECLRRRVGTSEVDDGDEEES